MALSATIHRCNLQVSDLDRGHYQSYPLTLARHPSETDERMMVRLLAFALNADERLSFTRGLSQDDEPDLWQHSLSGDITLWIETGQPDEKRLKKACGRADEVRIYCYQHRAASVWWTQNAEKLQRFEHLSIFMLPEDTSAELAKMAERNMDLQCTVQEGEVWFSNESQNLQFSLRQLR